MKITWSHAEKRDILSRLWRKPKRNAHDTGHGDTFPTCHRTFLTGKGPAAPLGAELCWTSPFCLCPNSRDQGDVHLSRRPHRDLRETPGRVLSTLQEELLTPKPWLSPQNLPPLRKHGHWTPRFPSDHRDISGRPDLEQASQQCCTPWPAHRSPSPPNLPETGGSGA